MSQESLANPPVCNFNGESKTACLVFVGESITSEAIWLSLYGAANSGSYRLEYAPNGNNPNLAVDGPWTDPGYGARISNSVYLGNGGVHQLYDNTSGSLIASNNQQHPLIPGIIEPPALLPPNIGWPGDPGYGRPPQPVHPIEPPNPVHPIEPPNPVHPIEPPNPVHPIEPPNPVHPIEPPSGIELPESERALNQRHMQNQAPAEKIICPEGAEDLAKHLLDEGYKHCFEDSKAGYAALPAITEGREFDSGKLWNVWADARLTSRRDEGSLLEIDTQSGVFALGIDKRIDTDLVVGMMVNVESSDVDTLNSVVDIDNQGFNLGPYIGYRLSAEWAMDFSVSYGWYDGSVDILNVLDGDFESEKISTMMNFTGQYFTEDQIKVKPKFGINYTKTKYDRAVLTGVVPILGAVELNSPATNTTSGDLNFSAEFSKRYLDDKGLATEPVLEIGAKYRVENWSGGDIEDPWSGEIRAGLRRQIDAETFIKIDAGYSSIGNSDVDEWDIGGFVSWQF